MELSRLTSVSRWARECLRDSQPGHGILTGRTEVCVVAVPTLCDKQTEVPRTPGDPLFGVGRAEFPVLPLRSGQRDMERGTRRIQRMHAESEIAGTDSEPGNLPQPRSRLVRKPQCIGNILTMGPGLHQTCRGHRPGTRGGTEP